MIVKGIILNKEDKSGTKKDGTEWKKWDFTLDTGERFSTFSDTFAENIHKDDTVEIEVEGSFNNIKEILKAEYVKPDPNAPKIENVPLNKAPITITEQRIIRQCCVKASCDLMSGADYKDAGFEKVKNDILKISEEFEKWVLR